MSQKKRYLVTHAETNQSLSPVAEILNLPIENIKNGVSFLATDATPHDKDVLEFPNVGVTSVTLDANEITRLKGNPNILAVEEDREMHILEDMNYEVDQDVQTENGSDKASSSNNSYQRGFQDGIQQYMENMEQQQFEGNNASQAYSGSQQVAPMLQKRVMPLAVQPIPWNIAMVKAPGAWARGITGTGIRVAILDTGIAAHADLNPISGGISFVPGVVSFNDGNGHGTHCTGLAGARNNGIGVVGVAPASRLFAVKVLSDTGSGMSSWIIAGMDWAAAQGMHVVSMSLGGTSDPSVAYAAAVKRLQDRGTVVVVAAGNSKLTAFPWVNAPANSIAIGSPNSSPIVVGSIDINRIIAASSSRGARVPLWNHVTVVAPGVNINSTLPGGGYGLKNGTSMATPQVAGAAALLKQRFPGISPATVKLRLQGTATDLGLAGYDTTYGSGLINCDRATL